MWDVHQQNISMVEGDYGIKLPITVSGAEFEENDVLKLVFKDEANGEVILEKEYTPTENTIDFELTAEESALFQVGTYVYTLDWYQSENFLCNIISGSGFKVVDKA